MTWVEVIIKWRDIGYLGVILILFTWVQVLEKGIAQDKLAAETAVREAQERATNLSNELVIQQAIVMGANRQTGVKYVDKIRNVTTPAPSYVDDERMRLGSHGVRDILEGVQPQAGGGTNGRQLPAASAGPRSR